MEPGPHATIRIGLLDHMGYGNLGDAATQDVLIANIRSRIPGAEIVGFSLNPEDTRNRHQIESYSITHWHPGLNRADSGTGDATNKKDRIRAALKSIPVFAPAVRSARNLLRETAHLIRTFTVLRSLDSLIVAGGGQLSDLWRGPWSHPYNVFKFSALTKAAARRLLFVNVGVGPLRSRLGRAFAKHAVNLADYVSFRDKESRALIQDLGVKRIAGVFPDSVYALNLPRLGQKSSLARGKLTVGINPLGYCDPRVWPRKDSAVYSRYIDKLAQACLWLIEKNYDVIVFSGEASVDEFALVDLKERLAPHMPEDRLIGMFTATAESVEELLNRISGFDFIVTSKFHGVIFSHLLEKPVLALSYGKKIDDLMRTVGTAKQCLPIEAFRLEEFKESFSAMAEDAERLKDVFREVAGHYSTKLNGQFDEIFTRKQLRGFPATALSEKGGAIYGGSA
jgi:polysaccharide pyruvyl transferase WcaK-like protein